MSIVGDSYLDGVDDLQVKILRAQNSIMQLNEELFPILESIAMKKIDRDKIQKQLWDLTWWERYQIRRRAMMRKGDLQVEALRFTFNEGNYKNDLLDVQPTMEEQDELIRNLTYKMVHESNCLAEERKLIRNLKQAEKIREAMAANNSFSEMRYKNGKQTHQNHMEEVYQAKLDKMKYEQKVVKDLEAAEKELQRFNKYMIKINQKRDEIHGTICALVKQLTGPTDTFSSPA